MNDIDISILNGISALLLLFIVTMIMAAIFVEVFPLLMHRFHTNYRKNNEQQKTETSQENKSIYRNVSRAENADNYEGGEPGDKNDI